MKIASSQFSYRFGQQIYMPYAIGILASYLKKHIPDIEFLPTAVDRSVVHDYAKTEADILLCSCYVWNWEINKVLMREWKQRNPNGLVIAGGPQIPDDSTELLRENSDIDVLIHGEGEVTLLNVVQARMNGTPLDGLNGVSTHSHPGYLLEPLIKNLDTIPSPYSDGTMESLIDLGLEGWLATWETMRGCPYGCSFCVVDSADVVTHNGIKKIRDVQIGERILGITDSTPVYGGVTNTKKSEGRKCIEIVTSHGALTLTPEHRIYEKTKGWIEAGECREGDCLYRMRQTGATKTQNMFRGVSEKSDQQPHEVKARKWTNNPSGYESGGKTTGFGANEIKQPNVQISYSAESRKREEGTEEPELRVYPRWVSKAPEGYAGKEPDVQSSDSGKGVCNHVNSGGPEQIRETNNRVHSVAQPPVSVRRQSGLLDRSVRFWKMQKSRFCSYRRGEMDNHGKRGILASTGTSRNRNAGLPINGVQGICDLVQEEGRNQTGDRFRDKEFFWDTVVEVNGVGNHTVVDIEVGGTHNFFADGLLVHNCSWGQSSHTTIRKYSTERLYDDINWFGNNKIAFIECADANFGMLPRDTEITEHVVAANKLYGYPKTFKPSWAKKMTPRVMEIAKSLNAVGLLTSIGCSLQSMDSATLKAVHRINVGFDEFVKIIETFKKNGTQCFTEIIRGLPGETLESFRAGLDRIAFESNVDTLYIYNCSMLENTDMKSPVFESYKLETVHAPIYFAHSSSGMDEITEYADLVISSSTFTRDDMEQMYLYSWYILAFQQLGILSYITKYLVKERGISYQEFFKLFESHCKSNPDGLLGKEYARSLEYIRNGYDGKGWNQIDPALGPIVWPIDEATWLRVTIDKEKLRREIYELLGELLTDELSELIEFQLFTLMDRNNVDERITGKFETDWIKYLTLGTLDRTTVECSYLNKITEFTDDFDWNTKAVWYGRRKMNYRARLEDINVN
jgi:radical SAM superfamily enzyme YgiQ (UPF0313 family)